MFGIRLCGHQNNAKSQAPWCDCTPTTRTWKFGKADPSEGLVAGIDVSSARGDFEFTLTAGVRRPPGGLPLSTVAVELEVQANRAIIDEASRRSGAGSRSAEVEHPPAS